MQTHVRTYKVRASLCVCANVTNSLQRHKHPKPQAKTPNVADDGSIIKQLFHPYKPPLYSAYSSKEAMSSQIVHILHVGRRVLTARVAQAPRVKTFTTTRCSLVGVMDSRNVAPPRASNPPPLKELPDFENHKRNKRPNVRTNVAPTATTTTKEPKSSTAISKEKLSRLPTSSWVVIRSIPPMSTLTDILTSVNEVMELQAEQGIVDLDAVWKGNGQVKQLEQPENWVRSAHLVLSSHGRPTGWRIEFSNRSCAHAFLEHSRKFTFYCAWKPTTVEAWPLERGVDAINVDDSMIRVENAGDDITVDVIRHLFRRYDMTKSGLSVQEFNERSRHKLFVVRFADASWARAAIRELQGVRVREYHLRLAQYPKQLVVSGDSD